ncbi:hypothetical protein VPNG_08312 [Cytospora leucostoma]|uniref:Thioesterase domain-containing protein n=1 Tax=Cytospora leucostoma TaxID=1230097 RepID=A0A423W9I6_9PEZI|nr:hypothetical protein VPNG_08312 [Cytospora leucostoma]
MEVSWKVEGAVPRGGNECFGPNHQRFESTKQAVDIYTAATSYCQPRGPYTLAGYSYGAMLVFDVAKRLGAGGDQVDFLGSFNLPPHIKHRIRTAGLETMSAAPESLPGPCGSGRFGYA